VAPSLEFYTRTVERQPSARKSHFTNGVYGEARHSEHNSSWPGNASRPSRVLTHCRVVQGG
jgi:hypothetical protein